MAYVIAIIGQTLIAYMLSVLMVSLAVGSVTGALAISLSVWLPFVVSTMTINHCFRQSSWSHSVIDGGHWLGVFVIQTVVLALMTA